MEQILLYLRLPVVHIVLLAAPMIFALDAPSLHRIMDRKFTSIAKCLLPILVGLAIVASVLHPFRYAMGAAILSPFLQWFVTKLLYTRFRRIHGRPPRIAEERRVDGSSVEDFNFRVSANVLVLGVPIVVIGSTMWITTSGHGY